MIPSSGLYVGSLSHRRHGSSSRGFSYPLFMALLDLDRLEELCAASRLVSRNRFNWAALWDEDYLPDRPESGLRARLAAAAAAEGRTLPGGKVFLLTQQRYLGVAYNPASFYYAYDPECRLALICAEVTNIPWMERHRYWMDLSQGATRFEQAKAFHVNPFLPMDLRYHWSFTEPGEALGVRIALYDQGELRFEVDLELAHRSWTAANLRRTLARFPWVTLKVVAAIHWQALRLWLRGLPVFSHP